VTVDRTRTVRRVDTPLGAATVRGKGGVDREADGIPAAAWRAKQGSADERAVAGRGRNAASPFPAPPTTSAGARRAAPQPVARPESRTSPALPNAAPGNGRSDHSDRGASGVREPGYVGGARAARPAAPTPAPDDRQGWRRSEPAARELGSDRRSPSARPATGNPAAVDRRGNVDGDAGDPPSYRRPDPRPQGTRVVEPSPGEPVRRVIGGVRRGSPAPTADSPRSAPPSVSPAPRAVPRATTPRPTYEAPRATPRPTYDAPRPTPRPTYDAPRPILRSPGQRTSPAPAPVDRTPRVTSPTSRSTRPTPHAVPTPRNAPAPRVIAPTTRNAPPPRVIVPTTRPTAPTVRTPSAPSSGSKATTTRGNSGTSQSRGGKSTAADPPRSSRAKGGGDKKGGDR
jgi:hypothetical protein